MGFVDDISDYRSLAIVGLEKNTGKTECLNYILRRIKDSADRFALTSIGIDGEPGSGMSNPETRDYRAGRNDIRYFGETLPGEEVGG